MNDRRRRPEDVTGRTSESGPVHGAAFMKPYSMPGSPYGRGRRESVPVPELTAHPYAAICRITGSSEQGTGFLVPGNRILTAAHVLSGGDARRIEFPGGITLDVAKSQWTINPGFKSNGDKFDSAKITASPPSIGGLRPIQLAAATMAVIDHRRCEIAGYAEGYAEMLRYRFQGAIAGEQQAEMTVDDGLIRHKFDTSVGQSGAPILAWSSGDSGQVTAIGIHTFGQTNMTPGWLNSGVAFKPDFA